MDDRSNLNDLAWQRSSYSAVGECVELAELPDGKIAVRNSNARDQGVLAFSREEIDAFLAGVAVGEFNRFGSGR